MLEQLHDIRWNTLRDAYGPAQPVPRLLRALAQPDLQTREDALARLWLGLCYQRACLEEASAHAVPFLIELATSPHVAGRAAILELVQGMAEVARRPTRDLAEATIFAATRRALQREFRALLCLLADGDADVRARAALAASALAHEDDAQRDELLALLAAGFAREPEPATRVAYVNVLEEHGGHEALHTALDDRSPQVLMAAAFALLGVDPPEGRAYRIVKASVQSPAQSARLYGTATRYRPLRFIARVCGAGVVVARALLPDLLQLLADSSDAHAEADLLPLLALFFPHGVPLEPSLEQSAILGTIAQHRHYFGRARTAVRLLESHGLPARPRLLRREALRGPLVHLKLVPKPPAPGPAADVLAGLAARELAGRTAEQLRSLHVVGVGSDALLSLLEGFPALEKLCLKSSDISATGLASLSALAELHTLELEDLELDQAALHVLASLRALRELSLTDVTVDSDPDELSRARPDLRLRVG